MTEGHGGEKNDVTMSKFVLLDMYTDSEMNLGY